MPPRASATSSGRFQSGSESVAEREVDGELEPEAGAPPVAGRAGRELDHLLRERAHRGRRPRRGRGTRGGDQPPCSDEPSGPAPRRRSRGRCGGRPSAGSRPGSRLRRGRASSISKCQALAAPATRPGSKRLRARRSPEWPRARRRRYRDPRGRTSRRGAVMIGTSWRSRRSRLREFAARSTHSSASTASAVDDARVGVGLAIARARRAARRPARSFPRSAYFRSEAVVASMVEFGVPLSHARHLARSDRSEVSGRTGVLDKGSNYAARSVVAPDGGEGAAGRRRVPFARI